MKTAGRENPTHGVAWPRNRAHGAAGQNRSRSIKWAAKQEKFQPKEMCFFLTSPFIELIRWRFAAGQIGAEDNFRAGDSGALSLVTGNKRLTRLFPGEWPTIRPQWWKLGTGGKEIGPVLKNGKGTVVFVSDDIEEEALAVGTDIVTDHT